MFLCKSHAHLNVVVSFRICCHCHTCFCKLMDRPSFFFFCTGTHPATFSLNIFYTNWFYVLPYSRWIALSNEQACRWLVYVKIDKMRACGKKHTVVCPRKCKFFTIFLRLLKRKNCDDCCCRCACLFCCCMKYIIEKLYFLGLHTQFSMSTLCSVDHRISKDEICFIICTIFRL